MKKKVIAIIFALLLMIPVLSISAKEKSKVKVYIFEAGGCPYCEAEVEYLKKLDSYNKKFTIVRKELYVDHVDWEQGKDYALGKAVAEKFQKDGFSEASYTGTPFVVISDIYAAAAYSENLETYINKAYKEGDKDVVSQIAKKLKKSGSSDTTTDTSSDTEDVSGEDVTLSKSDEKSPSIVVVIIGAVVLVGAVIGVIMMGGNKEMADDDMVLEAEEDEKPVRKSTEKAVKRPVKKPVKKTNNKK